MIRTLLVLGACLPAVPAAADCLASSDLEEGVRVSFANGDWTEIFTLEGGIVVADQYWADLDFLMREAGYLGVYRTYYVDLMTGSEEPPVRSHWPFELAEFPVPAPDEPDWTGRALGDKAYEDGSGELWGEEWTVEFGPALSIAVPDCTYEAVEVRATFVQERMAGTTEPTTLVRYYLPALGAAVPVSVADAIVAIEPIGAP